MKRNIHLPTCFDDDYYIDYYNKVFSSETVFKEIQFLQKCMNWEKGSTILDLPCGYGRYSKLIAKMDFSVVGVDLSKKFVEHAKYQSSMNERYIVADMRTFKSTAKFEIVLVLNTSWGYFSHNENLQILDRLASLLKINGKICIDLMNPDYLEKNLKTPAEKTSFVYDALITDHFSYQKESKNYKINRKTVTQDKCYLSSCSIRCYTFDEMKKHLNLRGLKIIGIYGSQKGRVFSEKSMHMVIIAQKTEPIDDQS